MAQINLHTTPELERALKKLMKTRGIRYKSEAIRVAVIETAERGLPAPVAELFGVAASAPRNRKPRFSSDDDLWND